MSASATEESVELVEKRRVEVLGAEALEVVAEGPGGRYRIELTVPPHGLVSLNYIEQQLDRKVSSDPGFLAMLWENQSGWRKVESEVEEAV